MNQSIRNLLKHLFENYGNITQLELEDKDTKMRSLWDPNSPFDCLVQQLEDGQDYTNDGGQPYTTDQLLRIAYTLVNKTGLYFEDCKAWNAKPNNEKTWTNFKAHFHRTQRLICDQLRTTKQAGFTSNIAIHPKMKPNHPPNIVKLSSISPLQPQPTANCSLLWPLPSPISTTTFKNSTKRPSPVSTTVKPLTRLSSLQSPALSVISNNN